MRNVKDIISDVITRMKPTLSTIDNSVTAGIATFDPTTRAVTDRLWIGAKVKATGDDSVVYYGAVTSFTESSTPGYTAFVVTFSGMPNSVRAITGAEMILSYHYGRPLEIVNKFKQITQNTTYNRDMFPAVCLFFDFAEKIAPDDREVSLHLVVITDTSKHFTIEERYTYSFDPILIPIYERFLSTLAQSKEATPTDNAQKFEHTKYDRPYWGKDGIYGATADIFNDFIDCVEIENLRIKIIKNC